MGNSKEPGRPSDDLQFSVETSDCEMEDEGDRESDVELADGDAPECDNSTEPSTPCKPSKTAPPETPDSGYYDGEESPLGAAVKLNPPKTLIGAIGDICSQIRSPLCSPDLKGPGYAYVFYDPSEDGDTYKIGRSEDPPTREMVYKSECKLDDWEMASRPYFGGIWGHFRLEQLAHKQLGNTNFKYDCVCGTEHREFFKGKNGTALAVLELWLKWLRQRPYDENGQLRPFWEYRLELLEPNFLSAFTCGEEHCPSKDESGPACAMCLMEGWKVWTTPPFADKAVFLAYTSVPWQMVFWRAFLFLFLYVSAFSAGNVYILACMLEGSLALAFYPHPELQVLRVFNELGMGPQPDDAGAVKHKTKRRKSSPKGKQPKAHGTPSPEKLSLSLSQIPSSPKDASPPSPSVKAARRKQGSTRSAPRQSSPSPGASIPSESSHGDETPAPGGPPEVDESGRKLRRSPRLREKRMRNMGAA